MSAAPMLDPNDWRTWPRDGLRLLPPPGTTVEQAIEATQAYSLALWGINPAKPRKDRRNVLRVLKKMNGTDVQVSFGRMVDGRKTEIRVRGGCRS